MHVVLILLIVAIRAAAGDWPQFLGPQRNGITEESVAGSWADAQPKIVWKVPVGSGFAGPIVVSNRVYVFHRQGAEEVLESFDVQTGQSKWRNKESTKYQDDFGFDDGPRAVPAARDGRVFAMGAEGKIRCVDAENGTTLWVVASKDKFRARKGFFGMVCSPLVHNDAVILNIGGEPGAGLIALDRNNGKLLWKARNDEASYSSPVIAELGGTPKLIAWTREALCVVDSASGKQLGEFPFRSRMQASVNAATPIVSGTQIFVTASYGTGAALLEWQQGSLRKIWANDDCLSSHYATPVLVNGFLYGFHGRQEYGPELRSVELKTGKVAWQKEGLGAGTIIAAGTNLLILRESGELSLIHASPERFTDRGNIQILGSGVRAYPALSGKRLFARDKSSLVCVALP